MELKNEILKLRTCFYFWKCFGFGEFFCVLFQPRLTSLLMKFIKKFHCDHEILRLGMKSFVLLLRMILTRMLNAAYLASSITKFNSIFNHKFFQLAKHHNKFQRQPAIHSKKRKKKITQKNSSIDHFIFFYVSWRIVDLSSCLIFVALCLIWLLSEEC